MGRVFVCVDPQWPAGIVCAAGPDGCGYCLGVSCKDPVRDGEQDWSHLTDRDPGSSGVAVKP